MEVIDRSPAGFLQALRDRLNKLLSSYWHEAEQFDDGDNEKYHTPHVHIQYLPISLTASVDDNGEENKRDKSKDFPLVLVSCTGGAVEDFSVVKNGSQLFVVINFGAYRNNPDNQGWQLVSSMMWRVLQDLLSDTILHGYILAEPVKWFLPMGDEPPYYEPPYYAAKIETVWKGCPPAAEFPRENNP